MTTSQSRVGGGAWIKGKESMKMSEIQQVMDSFEENSVLKTKDKPENLQDLIAVSGKLETYSRSTRQNKESFYR